MRLLDLTLPTAAENLALDEALLDEAESAPVAVETLRLWEPTSPLVVVGRSSQVAVEVNVAECQRLGIPVLRRTSGGASIVSGPGCLMYALVLSYELRPELKSIDQAHAFVLRRTAAALSSLVADVALRGTSDLAMGERKFSGNSLRCKRRAMLYHGTLLCDFRLELVETCLKMPPRMPDYRGGRGHLSFIANLPVGIERLRAALIDCWSAADALRTYDRELVGRLAAEKYSQREWNWQR